MNLADFDALSFDCYGTLIDWETGIASILVPWAREAGLDLTEEELLLAYAGNEEVVEREIPTALDLDCPRRVASPVRRENRRGGARRIGRQVRCLGAYVAGVSRLARRAEVIERALQADHSVQCAS